MFRKVLSKLELDDIRSQVEESEKKTSGEIVPVFVQKSDNYSGAVWRIVFASSLTLTYLFYYFLGDIPLFDIIHDNPFYSCIMLEILFVPVGLLIAQIPFIFRFAITKKELEEEVYQKALEMFHAQGVSNTRDRTGILIYVSYLERQVIILADQGIHSKVPENAWDEIVSNMIASIKRGKIGEAYMTAIKSCGDYLAKEFPIKDDDTNELSNDLVQE